jgi:hypothetical protein
VLVGGRVVGGVLVGGRVVGGVLTGGVLVGGAPQVASPGKSWLKPGVSV